ncbi:MAG: putative Ig domain-containing protein, partial [Acidobacteriota bacterium]
TALAASGGSPAYTWSIPTSGGALPPGVALTAAGAVSGVPTTAGTYSFTAQATDTAGQVAQKAFSLAIAAAPTTAATSGYLFQEGFENGTFAAWAPTQIWPALNPAITNSFAHSGTHSYVQYFNLCGDSTNTACLGPTQDVNRFIYTYFDSTRNNSPNGLSTVYLRAYLYLKHPEPDGTVDVMRKLYWIADEQSGGWSGILKTDGFSGVQKFTFGINGSSLCGISAQTNAFTYQGGIGFDAWHSIELGVQLNTPGLSDGVVTLWVDGTQVAQNSGYNIRGNCTTGTQFISIGRQSQRNNYNVIDEYRYWDDIVVSGSYIGP